MASYYGYSGEESPSEYLENNIFPILLPGLEEMLKMATNIERRKRFNSLDYLVTYLYRNNQGHSDRGNLELKDIPFVMNEWAKNPRPPQPLSATLTEEEACTIIQAHYRGYLERRLPEARLFRQWQEGVREERRTGKIPSKTSEQTKRAVHIPKKADQS